MCLPPLPSPHRIWCLLSFKRIRYADWSIHNLWWRFSQNRREDDTQLMRPVPNLEQIILLFREFWKLLLSWRFVAVIITQFIYSQRVFRSTLHNTIIIHLVNMECFCIRIYALRMFTSWWQDRIYVYVFIHEFYVRPLLIGIYKLECNE